MKLVRALRRDPWVGEVNVPKSPLNAEHFQPKTLGFRGVEEPKWRCIRFIKVKSCWDETDTKILYVYILLTSVQDLMRSSVQQYTKDNLSYYSLSLKSSADVFVTPQVCPPVNLTVTG